MKHDLKNRDVEKFTRSLIKHFGRVRSREILHFLLENAKGKSIKDIQALATEALGELDRHKKSEE